MKLFPPLFVEELEELKFPKMGCNQNYDYLLGKIQSLEKRLSGIETLLKVEWVEKSGGKDLEPITKEKLVVNNTESKIVEYGLAWLGSILKIN